MCSQNTLDLRIPPLHNPVPRACKRSGKLYSDQASSDQLVYSREGKSKGDARELIKEVGVKKKRNITKKLKAEYI